MKEPLTPLQWLERLRTKPPDCNKCGKAEWNMFFTEKNGFCCKACLDKLETRDQPGDSYGQN